jgi:prepilin-type N-terminal cleavage/methylation domain-containing protein
MRTPPISILEKTNRRAFTLLEILVVLALMAVLFTLAAVHFGGISEERALAEPATEIKALARKAQRTAVLENRSQTLSITPSRVGDVNIPTDVQLLVRPWGTKQWHRPGGEDKSPAFAWNFDPSGLCEPIGLRLELGPSSYEIDFHPLTGGVDEERVEIIAQP